MLDRVVLPCNGCTACCGKHKETLLQPERGDNISTYDYEVKYYEASKRNVPMLKRKPDGSCVYLGDRGCTIWERAPLTCQEFDCRAWFKGLTRSMRRLGVKQQTIDPEVLAAGRARLNTLVTRS